jgi:hypothetical protein
MTEQLHTKAIRIHLLWGYWKPEKTDKAITRDTNATLGVRGNRGHYDKELFSPEYMRRLREHTSRTKAYYYNHSLPWEDRVSRLISTKSVEEVSIELNRAVQKYDDILLETVGDSGDYQQAIYDQRVYMGSAWNEADYPRRSEFMAKYHAHLDILPLVTTTDLRCELPESLRRQITESVERDTEERFKLAMADVWRRLYEPVKRMAETLADPKAVFRDSLIDNVRDICNVVPELNILDDPRLNAMVADISARLVSGADADTLRESGVTREEYAKKADELSDILSRMGVN